VMTFSEVNLACLEDCHDHPQPTHQSYIHPGKYITDSFSLATEG